MAEHLQVLTFRVDATTLSQLKANAKEANQDISGYIRSLLEVGLSLTGLRNELLLEIGTLHAEFLKREALASKELENLRAFVSAENEKLRRLLKVSVGGLLMQTTDISEEEATAWVGEYLDD